MKAIATLMAVAILAGCAATPDPVPAWSGGHSPCAPGWTLGEGYMCSPAKRVAGKPFIGPGDVVEVGVLYLIVREIAD